MIKTETRHFEEDGWNKFWNLPDRSHDYNVFVNDDGREVDYDFVERKYGEATEENAQKFFDEQAKNDEEDWKNKEGWELVDECCKPFYTR